MVTQNKRIRSWSPKIEESDHGYTKTKNPNIVIQKKNPTMVTQNKRIRTWLPKIKESNHG